MVGTPCCGEADAYWADDVHIYTSHDGDKCTASRPALVRWTAAPALCTSASV
jgi:hypothetical protein